MASERCVERPWRAARVVVPDAAMTVTGDDRALVEASLAGDRSAFDTIVERHQRQVYQVCYRFMNNHEDAADLAQDVFVRAYRGLRGFKGNSTLA
ncbi:MAG TPA: sigma factor, partial [Vicinamibacterales bacterium]